MTAAVAPIASAAPRAPNWPLPQPFGDRRAALIRVVRELERRKPPADLHPKQLQAFSSEATEILYGGAAGGGKSHLFRRAAITWCQWVPGLQVYIFRREFADLFKNHMEGVTGFPAMLADLIARGEARIVWSKNQIRFKNGPNGAWDGGSVIHLCHCQHEKDVYGYQGAEIHVLIIDELTQWTRKMYTFLRSRVRTGGLRASIPKWLRHLFPRILCGANPGGIGHNWVKADFVDIAAEGTVTSMPKKEGGMLRQFIRALLEDNPSQDPEEYEGKLEGIGDPELARAMRRGDWDIVAGGFFDDLWRRDVHVLAPFAIPGSWSVDRSFDWGSSKPFSVGWWAESDGTDAIMADGTTRRFPRGTLFRINEWYGWNGQANEGVKMSAKDIARGILEREAQMRVVVNPGPADPSIFAVENEMCIAADMEKVGVYWLEADNSPGTRATRWQKLRDRLEEAKKAVDERRPLETPGLYVFSTCLQFIRTVPVLPRDANKRDDIDTKAEDHIADETGYRLLQPKQSAPRTTTFRFR